MRGLVFTLAALVASVSCVSTLERHAEALRGARAALNGAPGQPKTALSYARAVTANLSEREAADRVVITDGEIAYAVDNLEKAAERVLEEAGVLFLAEGDLWLAARKADKAEDAYRRSLKAKPAKEPLWALIGMAGRSNKTEQVRALCVEGARAVPDQELNQHIETCAHFAQVNENRTVLEWLSDDDQRRHQSYMARRHAREEAEQAEKAARHKKYALCSARCDEKKVECVQRCRDDKVCQATCDEAQASCNNACSAAVAP